MAVSYTHLLNARIRQLAFLNKSIRLVLCDEREAEPKRIEYKYDGGIRQYVEYLNKNKTPLHEEVVYVEGIEDGILAEIAKQYNDGYIPSIYSFCNNINTMEAVSYTHLDVYKRQVQINTEIFTVIHHINGHFHMNTFEIGLQICFHEFTNIISTVSRYGCFAVSYTHLDVYKRQVYRLRQLELCCLQSADQ